MGVNWAKIIGGLTGLAGGAKAIKEAIDESGISLQRPVRSSKAKMQLVSVNSMAERVSYIQGQIQKARNDPDLFPKIRQTASRVLTAKCPTRDGGETWCVPEKNWEAEVTAIFTEVRKHVRYTLDPNNRDMFQHPARIWENGTADCDDYTIMLVALLDSVGYPCMLKLIQTKGYKDFNHIYIVVGLPPERPKAWKPLDASVDAPPGWEAPRSMVVRSAHYLAYEGQVVPGVKPKKKGRR